MADVRGPVDTKGSPVDSTLAPWIRVGYDDRLNAVFSFNNLKFITYNTIAASNSSSVKRVKRRVNQSYTPIFQLYGVRLSLNTY